MLRLSGPDRQWQSMQDQLIAIYSHTATITFKPVYSGVDSSFDAYLYESLGGQDPTAYSGIDVSRAASMTVSGMTLLDYSLTSPAHAVLHLNIGSFEGGKAVFTCRISDATVSGVNVFSKAETVDLSASPGEKYIVDNWYSAGLIEPYVYYVVLRKTNLGS